MKFNKYVEKIEHEYKHLSELTTEMCTFCKELQHNEHYLAKDKETQELAGRILFTEKIPEILCFML